MRTRLPLLSVLIAATAFAGTSFRLEIGPPVALGTNVKMKGIAVAARATLCDDLTTLRVTATAEYLLNGNRQSAPLQIVSGGTPGVYGVSAFVAGQGQFQPAVPAGTPWLIHVSGTCSSPKAQASTLVPMRDTTFFREKVEVLREPATARQIDAALAALQRTQS
jgi:hypothetical protein